MLKFLNLFSFPGYFYDQLMKMYEHHYDREISYMNRYEDTGRILA